MRTDGVRFVGTLLIALGVGDVELECRLTVVDWSVAAAPGSLCRTRDTVPSPAAAFPVEFEELEDGACGTALGVTEWSAAFARSTHCSLRHPMPITGSDPMHRTPKHLQTCCTKYRPDG